jgi:hypothetical protein
LSLIAEVDRRRLWALDGHHGLASWLRWKYRLCRQTSKEKARVARGARLWAAATAAFASGDIPYSALRQIVRLPAHDAAVEQRLIDLARVGTTDDVARVVNRALDLAANDRYDPDGRRDGEAERGGDGDTHGDTGGDADGDATGTGAADDGGTETGPDESTGAGDAGTPADRRDDGTGSDPLPIDTADQPGAEVRWIRDAFDRRRFWAARTFEGNVTGGFTLAPAEGSLLLAALDTYLDGRHPGAPWPEGVAAATPSHLAELGLDPRSLDPRTLDQRRADALVEMACAYLAGGAPDTTGADRHTLNVLCDVQTLAALRWHDDARCETLDGTPLPVSILEKLRCDTSMVRVLTNDGRILDIGTRDRNIPPALRKKLLLRDGGCTFPGCPHTRWIDAHHIWWVEDGGPTTADNLVLLCGFHHHLVHDKGWRVTGDPEADGVTFHRPDGIAIPAVPPRREAA